MRAVGAHYWPTRMHRACHAIGGTAQPSHYETSIIAATTAGSHRSQWRLREMRIRAESLRRTSSAIQAPLEGARAAGVRASTSKRNALYLPLVAAGRHFEKAAREPDACFLFDSMAGIAVSLHSRACILVSLNRLGLSTKSMGSAPNRSPPTPWKQRSHRRLRIQSSGGMHPHCCLAVRASVLVLLPFWRMHVNGTEHNFKEWAAHGIDIMECRFNRRIPLAGVDSLQFGVGGSGIGLRLH